MARRQRLERWRQNRLCLEEIKSLELVMSSGKEKQQPQVWDFIPSRRWH